jgi:quercetin dioxygenase-like cupin family protein
LAPFAFLSLSDVRTRQHSVLRNSQRQTPGAIKRLFDLNQDEQLRFWQLTLVSEQPLIDSQRQKILSLAKETQFASNGIVSRTLLRTPTTRVVLFGFAAGQELTEHTSTQHALIQVLSGQCEFSLAGKPHKLTTGDLLYMPPNLPHAVKATEQFSMLLTLFKPAA